MLSPREYQQSLWSRLKTPAAVSLACLAATLLIAAQGFRSHPAPQKSIGLKGSGIDEAIVEAAASQGSIGTQHVGVSTSDVLSSTGLESLHWPQHSQPDDVGSALTEGSGLVAGRQDTAEPQYPFPSSRAEPANNLTSVLLEMYGMEVVVINNTSADFTPRGILLVFHGCSHSALDWWLPSATCTTCEALPEELAIAKAALRRSFLVVAFSSLDRELHRCWDASYPPETSADVLAVIRAWQALVEQENWGRIPHYAMGASSGGAFVLMLAQRVPFDGVCPIAMSAQPHTLDARPHTPDLSKSWAFPPVFFIFMERDELTADGVAANIAALRKQGVPVNEIVVKPRPLHPAFFSERIEEISNGTSAAMYNALLAEGCLNSTGFLVDNPRSLVMMRKWQKALRERIPNVKSMNLNKDESPVFETLNVAYASHELVSDHTDEVLDWFAAKQDGPKLMTAVNPRRCSL